MNPQDLRQELDSGRFRPAYLLLGEEVLWRDDALSALRERVLGDGPTDFNLDVMHAEAANPTRLREAVGMLPVMAERRLVLLLHLDDKRAGGKALAEALAKVVPELAAMPDPVSTVLVVSAARADRRQRWVKAFNDPCQVVACDPPRGRRALVDFARQEADRQGIELEPAAAEALVDRVGPQLLMMRQEIAKTALLVEPGQPIAREHVLQATSDVAEEPIWDLTDAIGQGQAGEALAVLGKLLRAGLAPPMVLGSLASHFRRLLRARAGDPPAGPPFVVRKLQDQARRYTLPRLKLCLEAIHEVDLVLKGSGGLPPTVALERLVMGLSA